MSFSIAQEVSYKELSDALKQEDPLVKADAAHKLAYYFLRKNTDSTFYFLQEAREHFGETDKVKVAENYRILGSYFLQKQKLDSSKIAFKKALKIDSVLKDRIALGYSYNGLSVVSNYESDYASAIKYQVKALNIAKEEGEEMKIAFGEYNLGMLHLSLRNYKKTKSYHTSALKRALKLKDSAFASYIYGALCNTSIKQKKMDSASYHLKQIELLDGKNTLQGGSYDYFQGCIDLANDNYMAAIDHFTIAKSELKNNKETLLLTYKNLASARLYKKEPEKALEQLKIMDSILKTVNLPYLNRYRDSLFYETYALLGDTNKSNTYFKSYVKLNDSLLSLDKIHTVNAIDNAYQNVQKDQTILEQEGKLKLYMSKNKMLVALIFISVVGFFLLLGKLYLRKRKLDKARTFIEEQYRQLEDSNLRLREKLLIVSKKLEAARKDEVIELKASHKYKRSSLTNIQRDEFMNRILEVMDVEKPYINTELSREHLAQQLDISVHHLSEVLNINFGQNYYNFINAYRVEEAKRILDTDNKNLTMLAIAFDSGFNSKASFNRVFKKITGTTPSQYKERRKAYVA